MVKISSFQFIVLIVKRTIIVIFFSFLLESAVKEGLSIAHSPFHVEPMYHQKHKYRFRYK